MGESFGVSSGECKKVVGRLAFSVVLSLLCQPASLGGVGGRAVRAENGLIVSISIGAKESVKIVADAVQHHDQSIVEQKLPNG